MVQIVRSEPISIARGRRPGICCSGVHTSMMFGQTNTYSHTDRCLNGRYQGAQTPKNGVCANAAQIFQKDCKRESGQRCVTTHWLFAWLKNNAVLRECYLRDDVSCGIDG